MTEIYFPKELWRIIKDYQIDYKAHHVIKNVINMCYINNKLGPIYTRWTLFPPPINTSQMQHEAFYKKPTPGLKLTTICWNIRANSNGGWYCGYGWKNYIKNPSDEFDVQPVFMWENTHNRSHLNIN